MLVTEVKFKKLDPKARMPYYGSEFSAGADLYAVTDQPVEIKPQETKFLTTGLAMEIPEGLVGLIYARSGLSCKQGLAPANKVGVVDSDYRGEVLVALHNHDNQTRIIENGDRIAQIIFTPYIQGNFSEVKELSTTERGNGGFGHSGK